MFSLQIPLQLVPAVLPPSGAQTPRGTIKEILDPRNSAQASGIGHSAQGGEETGLALMSAFS